MKKIIKKLSSMKFAVSILVVIGFLSMLGSVIPQNMETAYYLNKFTNSGNIILTLQLNRIFSAWYYLLCIILLVLSTIFCAIIRIKPLINKIKREGFKYSIRSIGSWVLHLGIILVIIFFSLGNIYSSHHVIYNVENTKNPIPDTNLEIEILDFNIILRPDDTVSQYISDVRVYEEGSLVEEGEVKVNQPLSVNQYQISQSSFGLAADCIIYKDGVEIGRAPIFPDEYVVADHDRIAVKLKAIYPDVEEREDGLYNASQKLKNPRIDMSILLGGNEIRSGLTDIEEKIPVGKYTVEFVRPRHFTYLEIRRDSFAKYTGIGALLLFIGMTMQIFGPIKTKEGEQEDV